MARASRKTRQQRAEESGDPRGRRQAQDTPETLAAATEGISTAEEKLAKVASFPLLNPNPIVEADLEGNVLFVNPAAGRTFPKSDQPQRVAESLCRKVSEHLGCQLFFNYLVDEASGRLHLNACAGIPDDAVRQINGSTKV